jgi:hypothetical protein
MRGDTLELEVGLGGGAMVLGLLFCAGEFVCCEACCCIAESMTNRGSSISSMGDSRAGVAMDCW